VRQDEQHSVEVAVRETALAFVHSDDIADVAVAALTTARYEGHSLPLSGPRALSYVEMTSMIGARIGKPLRTLRSDVVCIPRRRAPKWGSQATLGGGRARNSSLWSLACVLQVAGACGTPFRCSRRGVGHNLLAPLIKSKMGW
jgi:uncharacterized protein YbjT (DUF2867 family)